MDTNNGMSNELVMTLAELATYLKVAEKTIHRMIGRNEIPCTKVGGQWRFFRPMIDDWLVAKMREGNPFTAGSVDTPPNQPDRWLAKEIYVKLDVSHESKEEALRSLLTPVKHLIPHTENYLSLLLERERMLSTAVGNGVAFPHLRHPQANPRGGPYLVVGICPYGVEYDSPDGNPVHLLLLFCAHDETSHLRGLSRLSVILNRPTTVRNLIASRSRDEVVTILTREEEP